MRLLAHTDFPFIEWRRRAYIISAIVLLAGLAAIVGNLAAFGSWLRYGVDFAGGTEVQVAFNSPVPVDDIRNLNQTWEIKQIGSSAESEFIIRIPTFEEQANVDPTSAVNSALSQQFEPDDYRIVRTEGVGPRTGAELQQRALMAILISFAITLAYLAIRFEWRFAVAAIAATGHDILITLGIIAALRVEVQVSTVAAFLTIVGYSLNDTIVVFDRIREDLTHRRGTFVETVNRAINETLPRTVLTTCTTLSTLVALYLFGGDVIRDFAMVLILGILIGTFSSIFIASPVLVAIEARWPRTAKKPVRSPAATTRRATATE